MTPEIKEAVAFIHDALELTLGLLADVADPDTEDSLEDIRSAVREHSGVLRAAGIIEAPVEPGDQPPLLEVTGAP